MKGLFKRFLKAIWRATAPLRRPVMRKIDNHVDRLFSRALDANVLPVALDVRKQLEQLLPATLDVRRHLENTIIEHTYETNLALNSLVREMIRLQMQVEVLQQSIDDTAMQAKGLSIVGEREDNQPCTVSA